jgi:hypothetical protein
MRVLKNWPQGIHFTRRGEIKNGPLSKPKYIKAKQLRKEMLKYPSCLKISCGRFFINFFQGKFHGKFRGKIFPPPQKKKMLGKFAIFRGKSFEKSFFQQIPRNFPRKITFRGKNGRKIDPRSQSYDHELQHQR